QPHFLRREILRHSSERWSVRCTPHPSQCIHVHLCCGHSKRAEVPNRCDSIRLAACLPFEAHLDKSPSPLADCTEIAAYVHEWGCCIRASQAVGLANELRLDDVWLGTYEDYILMKSPYGVLGIPSPLASWDLSKKGLFYN